jgi:hypothetical protein
MTSYAQQPELLFIAARSEGLGPHLERAGTLLSSLPGALLHPSPLPGRLHLTTGWHGADAFFCGSGVFGSALYKAPNLPPAGVSGRGCFMVARWGEDGTVRIEGDPLGMFSIFVFDRDGILAVSTNGLLLELALKTLGRPLTRSNILSGFMVTLGSGYDGITGFEDVRLLAAGEALSVDRENRASYQKTHVGHFLYSNRTFQDLLDEAADEVQSNVEAISKLPVQRRICDLTGGMDSRLVLAAILHKGLQDTFEFQTNGSYPNPDANAAALIRQTFGLAKALPVREHGGQLSPLDRMRRAVASMSGLLDMFMAAGSPNPNVPIVRLGGGLGEILRKFWSSDWSRVNPGRSPLHNLMQSMETRSALVRPDVFSDQLSIVSAKGFEYLEHSIAPTHIGDAFYLTARCQYHFGVWWTRSPSRFHPLYSPAGLRAAHAIPDWQKEKNRVGYEMIRRMSPKLLTLPFANKKWNSKLHADAPAPITVQSPRYGQPAVKPKPKAAHTDTSTSSPVRPPDRKPAAKKPKPAAEPLAFAATMESKGAHRKVGQLPAIMETFVSAYPDADYAVLGDVFDPGAVSRFMSEALKGFEDTKDTWMAYRIMMAFLWATRQETWAAGGDDDIRAVLDRSQTGASLLAQT